MNPIQLLDLNASGSAAIAALKANGTPRRKTIVLAALRHRREGAQQ